MKDEEEEMVLSPFSLRVVSWGLASLVFGQSDVLKIENRYTKRVKAPVTFNHKKHAESMLCIECHHEWKKEAAKDPQKCAECHREKSGEKVVGLKSAYHTTCQGCHKKLVAQAKKGGPTAKCSECHV